MDPSIDLPATNEPAAHIAQAANPTPIHGPNHNHPPYAEMITAAIAALKEKKGSSRRAIAKYIDKEYSNLPTTHSALLTHHLKRLKNSGLLLMVKHSYKLPTSDSDYVPLSPANPSSYGPNRGPGRPPKPKPQVQPNAVVGTASVLVSVGLVEGPPTAVAKRGRGRPPKVGTGLIGVESSGTGPSLGKRGRGRPPRPKLLSMLMVQGGPKRGPGRPPGTRPTSVLGSGGVPRPRGRPKKADFTGVKLTGRPRGRPPKNVAVNGGFRVLQAKRPGRPPKMSGAKKPRKLAGRPVGRPKKNAIVMANQAANQQQLIAYQDLKFKLEHFQSRIKLAVGMVKPCLNNETASIALGALQELEELATMDVSASLTVQSQEPPLQN